MGTLPVTSTSRREIAQKASDAARNAAIRRRHEKWAKEMRAVGWSVSAPVVPPSDWGTSRIVEENANLKWQTILQAISQSRRGIPELDMYDWQTICDDDIRLTDETHDLLFG